MPPCAQPRRDEAPFHVDAKAEPAVAAILAAAKDRRVVMFSEEHRLPVRRAFLNRGCMVELDDRSLEHDAHGHADERALLGDEPADAVAIDEVILWPRQPTPAPLLPPGRYTVHVLDRDSAELHRADVEVGG